MTPPLQLSHLPQHYLTDGQCDLTVNTSIDTTARKVDGTTTLPAGTTVTIPIVNNGALTTVLTAPLTVTVTTVGNVVTRTIPTVTAPIPGVNTADNACIEYFAALGSCSGPTCATCRPP